ncbi:hypothetical protein BDZ90DRAFT_127639 [Jaminaea rosea]|uniref:Uncharacterized protein n=1 Tax=Jaminaea rosea TaxID=1569628 RepID=A0A316UJ22_9BASI|nr:hypothetical protein BDZ90DRAFT_127639 [Jaminaea rosea]PWN24341.1 hypothetical protein BDZ90DRAFT_127639 [Jaminaea rosea]
MLGDLLQTAASSMPLLLRSAQVCALVKSGVAGVEGRNLLTEVRQALQTALSQPCPHHYDVLTSMLALTEVWDLSDLFQSSRSILKVDAQSTQAKVRLVEPRLSMATTFSIPVNVNENGIVYWSVCSAAHLTPSTQIGYLSSKMKSSRRCSNALAWSMQNPAWSCDFSLSATLPPSFATLPRPHVLLVPPQVASTYAYSAVCCTGWPIGRSWHQVSSREMTIYGSCI